MMTAGSKTSAILTLARTGQKTAALDLATVALGSDPDCPYLLVLQALLIQVLDDPGVWTLGHAEESLSKALEIDPDYMPAHRELAHFYDAVMPNQGEARLHAARFLELAEKGVQEMKEILQAPAIRQEV